MSTEMVTVRRTDPDGTVHTYAWPKSLAEADDSLTIVPDEPAGTREGLRKPEVAPPTEPVTEPVSAPAAPPATEPRRPARTPDVKED